jgi:hypothetical protein
LLQNEVLGAEALQDEDSSPQFWALCWPANEDTAVLDLDSMPTVIIVVKQCVLTVLYFATSTEGRLNRLNFLSASLVCEWHNGERGVSCNRDDLVADINLGKSKHQEVVVLFQNFALTHLLTFHWGSEKETETALKGSIPSKLGKLMLLTLLRLSMCIGLSFWHECHSCSDFLAILFDQIVINSWVQFLANSENLPCWLYYIGTWIGLSCWHECHACSHFLAILFDQILINSRVQFWVNSENLHCWIECILVPGLVCLVGMNVMLVHISLPFCLIR